MDKRLILMRGLPGSGKSFLAKQIAADNGQSEDCIASADDYFMKDGKYQWDPDKLRDAHGSCKRKVRRLMKEAAPLVIVDNTNTKRREMKAYVYMAIEFGYDVEFATPDTSWAWDVDQCCERNTHGVPKPAIQAMAKRFDKKVTAGEMVAEAQENS